MRTIEEIKATAQVWLSGEYDEETQNEVKAMLENEETELVNSFYKNLEFGTGGMRGVMGAGTNKINKYTIGAATQGLANYLLSHYAHNDRISVAIAYDCRNKSDFFARVAANVLTSQNIHVFLFPNLRPTPELSFAIRNLSCEAGIVITASHNPKEYNGYKVYGKDGGQIISPEDKAIVAEVNKIKEVSEIGFEAKEEYLHMIDEDQMDQDYMSMIASLFKTSLHSDTKKNVRIVYSSIHGTGITLVPKLLKRLGFEQVRTVEAQDHVDGNFPTVVYPNPEEQEAFSMSLEEATKFNADIALATDPDSDRVGIAIPKPSEDSPGEYVLLNGNQIGALLFDYLLSQEESKNSFVAKTIVTSELIKSIAEKYGVACYDTLTGFKFIASLIAEKQGREHFVVGCEESYGYLVGDKVRDKDAISAVALLCDLAAETKKEGKSLYQRLNEIYVEHSFYKEKLVSITKKGKEGEEEINAIIKSMREVGFTALAGSPVVKVIDYQRQIIKDVLANTETPLKGYPKSNVLQFFTQNGDKISVRPSGTEPKIKLYFSTQKQLLNVAHKEQVEKELDQYLNMLYKDMEVSFSS